MAGSDSGVGRTRAWRFRRYANRYLNPITRSFAGKLPAFGILTHRGRKSGRVYRTPINVFRRGDDYYFFLTYGSDVQWVKNVLAAGSCSIETRGREVELVDPALIDDPELRPAPFVVRMIEGRIAGVTQYVRMRAVRGDGLVGGNEGDKLAVSPTKEGLMSTTSGERTKLGYGLSEDEGEAFWLFGALVTIKISGEDTAGQYCLLDVEAPPGVGSPWHVHRDEDEWFYVRDGAFELYVGDAHLTLTAGGFAFGPKGVPHTFFGGPAGGKMFVGCGPQFEGLLRDVAEPATEHVLPPPPEGPPDMARLLPLADKWAYEILGPPGPPPGH